MFLLHPQSLTLSSSKARAYGLHSINVCSQFILLLVFFLHFCHFSLPSLFGPYHSNVPWEMINTQIILNWTPNCDLGHHRHNDNYLPLVSTPQNYWFRTYFEHWEIPFWCLSFKVNFLKILLPTGHGSQCLRENQPKLHVGRDAMFT